MVTEFTIQLSSMWNLVLWWQEHQDYWDLCGEPGILVSIMVNPPGFLDSTLRIRELEFYSWWYTQYCSAPHWESCKWCSLLILLERLKNLLGDPGKLDSMVSGPAGLLISLWRAKKLCFYVGRTAREAGTYDQDQETRVLRLQNLW